MPNRFSDRIGATNPPELATTEASDALSAALWNTFEPFLFADAEEWPATLRRVYAYLHWLTYEVPHRHYPSQARERLNDWYFSDDRVWYEIYNFCEFAANLIAGGLVGSRSGQVYQLFNGVLEKEGLPYRFVQGVLTTITDPTEIRAVHEALRSGDRFIGAREHLAKALQFLGLRPEPEFRNTIKEAISAVESALKVLTGHAHADLAEALREFARAHPIHGALFKGLDSLHGYTSNEHGLRHALLEADANVGFAEAKFMVVACSAFVSYLIAREAP
jgi:hypothetical protein